jgi:UDP-glucose 4-epimerase
MTADARAASGGVFNIACGQATDLNQVVALIGDVLGKKIEPRHEPERAGDIKHSWADISAARKALGYTAGVSFAEGLRRTVDWYKTKA